jgi:hypothetical protein
MIETKKQTSAEVVECRWRKKGICMNKWQDEKMV